MLPAAPCGVKRPRKSFCRRDLRQPLAFSVRPYLTKRSPQIAPRIQAAPSRGVDPKRAIGRACRHLSNCQRTRRLTGPLQQTGLRELIGHGRIPSPSHSPAARSSARHDPTLARRVPQLARPAVRVPLAPQPPASDEATRQPARRRAGAPRLLAQVVPPGCEYTTPSPHRRRLFSHKDRPHKDLCKIVKTRTIFPPRRAARASSETQAPQQVPSRAFAARCAPLKVLPPRRETGLPRAPSRSPVAKRRTLESQRHNQRQQQSETTAPR